MRFRFGLVAALLGLCVCASAQAQTSPLIIDSARPDRAPPVATAPRAAEASPVSGEVAAPPRHVRSVTFSQLQVQGSSLSSDALRAAAQPLVGQTLTRENLKVLADGVGRIYAASDVALYTILVPQQTFEGGKVRLVVVEGYLAKIEVKGVAHSRKPILTRSLAARMQQQRPLRKSTLERYLGLMRDIPGARPEVQVLQDGAPGAVRLVVDTKTRRVESSLSVNNRGSSFLGRTQIQGDLTFNGLFREGDQTRLTVAAPTEIKRFQYLGLSHSEVLNATGATVALNLGYLRTRPKIAGIDLTGQAVTAGIVTSYPLIRSNTRNLNVNLGLDGLNSDNALFGRLISDERTRGVRLAAAYSAQSATTAMSTSVTLSQGVDGLGARMADPRASKAGFTKVNAQVAQAGVKQQFSWRVVAAGQYGADRLPASEKFAVGGAQFGRAFSSAVASGDSGYGVSAEVGWKPKALGRFTGSEVYVFGDYGKLFARGAVGPRRTVDLASVGGGTRIAWSKKLVTEFEVAKAVDDAYPRPGAAPWRLMINVRTLF